MECIGAVRGRDMVPCTNIIVGRERVSCGSTIFTQMKYTAEESFFCAEGIVSAIGISDEIFMFTIILCDEFKCVKCGSLGSCGLGGDSF